MRATPTGVLMTYEDCGLSLRTSPITLPRVTTISVTDGLGSFSSFWYWPSTMRSDTTWRKVRTSTSESGLTMSVEPLERISSAVEAAAVSTR